jgi:fatty acid desaturase
MGQYIPDKLIRRQAWKFWFLMIAWPAYILFLPLVFDRLGWWSLFLMVFPGVYLFTWVACLMHESWHKYLSNIPNIFFYKTFSYYLVMDPQIYRLIHGYHHSKVNMWDDTEFHPIGCIDNTFLRRLYNLLEILFGAIFIFGIHVLVVPKHPQYKNKYRISGALKAMIMWVAIYGGLGSLSAMLFGINGWNVAIAILISFWLNSFFIHHVQLIEHGEVIIEGNFHQRNVASRNLTNNGIIARMFHFLTHGDSRQHVLHHTQVEVYSRPFPGKVPLPKETITISPADYMKILWHMVAG